ncbi:vomeronasal type-2 receptor 26-like [Protopterus annectens]|uniref:vomeronasal type-2 receptor 26-like n=1 Tax=Protopterus annectens TaxID=7888 RepID=UPI001CFB2EAB|nr:vomeronasal type-2 receptor 26-like [Protopterus annectens]
MDLLSDSALPISSSMQSVSQSQSIPHSVCSESCPVGHRRASQEGQPDCCFNCLVCSESEIANQTDSNDCMKCAAEFWPNAMQDKCVPKPVEFLSYADPLGALLSGTAILSSFIPIAVFCVFLKHHDTPVVKANNRELSYLLLLALVPCFLCSLIFIGLPIKQTCMLRQTAFGVIFTFCVSCVLVKTVMVVIAFKATKPNSHWRLLVGYKLPSVIVSFSTLIQVVLCTFWLVISPPFPERNSEFSTTNVIIACNEGSSIAFWVMLSYMAFLACMSFLLAYFARKLPDIFNEASCITFSMLVFLSVWLSFVPAYLSTNGKYMVAVEIFAIISSSAGLLVSIFFPKCHIILLKPRMNTRQYLTGKGTFKGKPA